MKRFLVNDGCLYRPNTGVAMYVRNVMSHWPADSEVRLRGVCADRLHWLRPKQHLPAARLRMSRLSALPARIAPGWARHCVRRILRAGFGRLVSRACRRGDYDGFFEPNHLPVRCDIPTVATVHDLSVLECSDCHPPERLRWWRRALPGALAGTSQWITVSHFTKRRMQEVLGLADEQIMVIHLAARPLAFPAPVHVPEQRNRLGLPERYFLHLGTIGPRKNLSALLDAYGQLPATVRTQCRLVLAGGLDWGSAEFFNSLREHPVAEEVLTTGYVDDHAAAVLLAGATAVVAPSVYEGFGLPILEAMTAGTPVICSSIEAFTEVGGEAAESVGPLDVPAWSAALQRAMEDEQWRQQCIERGHIRAEAFSWHRTARRHAELLASLVC